ncbi:hypothetical protein Hanom_Chr12g01101481 [Helianthus anomalus]
MHFNHTSLRSSKLTQNRRHHSVRNTGLLGAHQAILQAPEVLAFTRIQATSCRLAPLLSGFSILCLFMV